MEHSFQISYRHAIILIIVIVVATIAITVWLKILTFPSKEQVFYNIVVSKSTYKFPQWNITLDIHENISLLMHSSELFYGEQKISSNTWTPLQFNSGDTIKFKFNMNIHIVSGENFTLFLWFEQNKYMQFNLTLPGEIS